MHSHVQVVDTAPIVVDQIMLPTKICLMCRIGKDLFGLVLSAIVNISMFVCHNERCGKDCKRIIGFEGKLYCENCYQIETPRPTWLHQRIDNRTIAKDRIIMNRAVSRDDGRTIIDKRTGKETQY